MTVAELIEELQAMPPTATVEVQIRKEQDADGKLYDMYDFRDVPIERCVYDLGLVSIRLDE